MELREKLEAYSKVSPTGCIEWQRAKAGNGYGNISIGNGKWDYAHRVSYKVHKGEIPEGYVVRHTCDNPCCVNPDHLLIGTQWDNVQDAISRGRASKPPVFMGASNNKTKLTDEEIQLVLTSTQSNVELAKSLNVSTTRIRQIRNKGGR